MIRRITTAIAVLLISWLGVLTSQPVPADVQALAEPTCTYDGHRLHADASAHITTECGPPVRGYAYNDTATPDAAEHRSRGPSARPGMAPPRAATTYNEPMPLVQIAGVATAIEGSAQATPAALALVARAGVATKNADEFWTLSNVGRARAGTTVPESFDITAAGQKYSVVPNATKHMAEYARSHGTAPPISSFAGSIESAVARGLNPGRNFVRIGPWELGIDTRGNVIYHALYRP